MTNRPLMISCLVGLAGACASTDEPRCTHAEYHAGAEAPHRGHGEHGGGRSSDPSHHHPGGGMQHDFSDVGRFEAVFDAPERAAWQRPVEVVRLLRVAPGQTVVDLGTGTGYFLPYLSVAVGADGHVVGLDSEPAMVEHVRSRALRESLVNVEARTVSADDVGLASRSVDRILVVNTWHHLADRARYVERLRDALRPGGVILVVEFTLESPQGPPVELRLAPEQVAAELASAGLAVEVVGDESLPDQYIVRATKH